MSFSRAQIEEIDALNAQGAEQARIDKAARIVEKIRNLGYIPPLDNRYPELKKSKTTIRFSCEESNHQSRARARIARINKAPYANESRKHGSAP